MNLKVGPPMVSHYPAKFDGYRHSGSGDINILANTVLLPQTQNTRNCICRSASVITLSKAHACHVPHASRIKT